MNQPIYPEAVCLFLSDGNTYLATSRRGTTDQWGLPGGKVDPGETPEQALVREIEEETSIVLDITKLKLVHTKNCGPGKDGRIFKCHAYTYSGKTPAKNTIPKFVEDGILIDWVSYDDLVYGPFGDYNKELFDVLRIYPHWISFDISNGSVKISMTDKHSESAFVYSDILYGLNTRSLIYAEHYKNCPRDAFSEYEKFMRACRNFGKDDIEANKNVNDLVAELRQRWKIKDGLSPYVVFNTRGIVKYGANWTIMPARDEIHAAQQFCADNPEVQTAVAIHVNDFYKQTKNTIYPQK